MHKRLPKQIFKTALHQKIQCKLCLLFTHIQRLTFVLNVYSESSIRQWRLLSSLDANPPLTIFTQIQNLQQTTSIQPLSTFVLGNLITTIDLDKLIKKRVFFQLKVGVLEAAINHQTQLMRQLNIIEETLSTLSPESTPQSEPPPESTYPPRN